MKTRSVIAGVVSLLVLPVLGQLLASWIWEENKPMVDRAFAFSLGVFSYVFMVAAGWATCYLLMRSNYKKLTRAYENARVKWWSLLDVLRPCYRHLPGSVEPAGVAQVEEAFEAMRTSMEFPFFSVPPSGRSPSAGAK